MSGWVGIASVVLAFGSLVFSIWMSSKKETTNQGKTQSKLEQIDNNVEETKQEVKLLREENKKTAISTAAIERDIKTLYHNDARLEKQVEVFTGMVEAVNRLADAVAKEKGA